MAMTSIKATVIRLYLFECYVLYNCVADTCYVQSHNKWIHYNDAKVSEVLSKQFTSSNEIKV